MGEAPGPSGRTLARGAALPPGMSAAQPHTTREALRELLEELVQKNPGVVVLFTDASCRVAEAVEPKLEALLRERFPNVRFDVVSRADAPELLAQLGIFSFPTAIVWFAGKETARFVRVFSLDEVAEALARPYALLFGS